MPSWSSNHASVASIFLPSLPRQPLRDNICRLNICPWFILSLPVHLSDLLICAGETRGFHHLQRIEVDSICRETLLPLKMENLPALPQPTERVRPKLMEIPREVRQEILRYCLLTSRNRSARWIISSMGGEHYARGVQRTEFDHPLRTNPIHGGTLLPNQGLVPEEIVYQLFPSVMSCCRQLLYEGRYILYRENGWLAVKWSGIADYAPNQPYDVFQQAGLQTRWITDSKRCGRLLGRLKLMEDRDEMYMPDMIFSIRSRESSREVRLIPISEVTSVMRALYISSQARACLALQGLGVQVRLALPLAHCNTQANRVLLHQMFLWIGQMISVVRLGSTPSSAAFSDSHLAVIASDIAADLTLAPSARARSQCQSLSSELDQVKLLRSQGRGRDVVARKLFLIIGQATDAIPTYQRFAIQQPDHWRFVNRVSRIRESAAWEVVLLDPGHFDYVGDTEYHTVLASLRHQLLMALFVKRSISRSQAPEDRRWRMQVHLRAAELFACLGEWSAAWKDLFQAVLTSRKRAVIGQLSDPVAETWSLNQLTATYERVGGDLIDVAHFVVAYIRSTSHKDFLKVLFAWADIEESSEVLEIGQGPL